MFFALFGFPILKSPLRVYDVEVIAIPESCLVTTLDPLGTDYSNDLVWEERFYVTSVQKDNF